MRLPIDHSLDKREGPFHGPDPKGLVDLLSSNSEVIDQNQWKEKLTGDPYVTESENILADMKTDRDLVEAKGGR